MNGSHERKHVLIAGGGIAGLEAMLALSKLSPELTDVELLSSEPEFVYRPLLVAEPFGVSEALRLDLAQVAEETGSRYTPGTVVSIQPDVKTVETAEGETVLLRLPAGRNRRRAGRCGAWRTDLRER